MVLYGVTRTWLGGMAFSVLVSIVVSSIANQSRTGYHPSTLPTAPRPGIPACTHLPYGTLWVSIGKYNGCTISCQWHLCHHVTVVTSAEILVWTLYTVQYNLYFYSMLHSIKMSTMTGSCQISVCEKLIRIMVLILDDNSEIGTDERRYLCYLIYWLDRQQSQIGFLSSFLFLYACTLCSELPCMFEPW